MSIRYVHLSVLLLGISVVISLLVHVDAAPPRVLPPDWFGTNACTSRRLCETNSGPVCAIDASGVTRTFENTCMVEIAFCRLGSYYAVVKPGEC